MFYFLEKFKELERNGTFSWRDALNLAKFVKGLLPQEPLAGPSSASDGEFISPGTLKTKKRSNEEENSIANVHQNSVQLSNTVPPVPAAAVEPVVLPSMVSETASPSPQLNQEPIESQHLNAQHNNGAFTYFIRFAFIHLIKFECLFIGASTTNSNEYELD